jgi:hypothetical protein
MRYDNRDPTAWQDLESAAGLRSATDQPGWALSAWPPPSIRTGGAPILVTPPIPTKMGNSPHGLQRSLTPVNDSDPPLPGAWPRSTALGIIRAHESGKRGTFSGRDPPRLQALTAWELGTVRIPMKSSARRAGSCNGEIYAFIGATGSHDVTRQQLPRPATADNGVAFYCAVPTSSIDLSGRMARS